MKQSLDIPKIDPVPPGIKRPRWSVMIPAYNCANYLAQTLESVLNQDPGPENMQIEVLDNCSSDDPEKIVADIGKGRVKFSRNLTNLGASGNWNACIQQSAGHLVHILHGDDYIAPDFYKKIESLNDRYPEAALYATRCFVVNKNGEIEALSPRVSALEGYSKNPEPIYYDNLLRCPAIAINRDFYEKYGGFCGSLTHTADWEMWVRAISRSGGVMLNIPLAYYRAHSENLTSRQLSTGELWDDYDKFSNHLKTLFPGFNAVTMEKHIAQTALAQAYRLEREGEFKSAKICWAIWRKKITLRQILVEFKKDIRRFFKKIIHYFFG